MKRKGFSDLSGNLLNYTNISKGREMSSARKKSEKKIILIENCHFVTEDITKSGRQIDWEGEKRRRVEKKSLLSSLYIFVK